MGNWFSELDNKLVYEPIGEGIKTIASGGWNWFLGVLPDIIGYSTYVAGGAIILGALVGSGGMMKPLSIYAGIVIVAVCLLTTV